MPLLETKGAASAQGFGGAGAGASGPVTYIEDVFSTYLYTGNGSTQTITNGIDLSGKGGLVWIKRRNDVDSHCIQDSARGFAYSIYSDATSGSGLTNYISSVNSSGFSLGSADTRVNGNTSTYASWTFRKQPKFFDVVTWTGNGTSNRLITHALGAIPAVIMIKATSTTGEWYVNIRDNGLNGDTTDFAYAGLGLNDTSGRDSYFLGTSQATPWTSTQFTLYSTGARTNVNGVTYVAYLFAHNAGGFGLSGTDNVISCGLFDTDSSFGNATVNLGYEPQWLLIKRATGGLSASPWYLVDIMRGWVNATGNNDYTLSPNTSAAEALDGIGHPTATGFDIRGISPSTTWFYIAIRRGPMKVPTSGTSVFSPVAYAGNGAALRELSVGFPMDSQILRVRNTTASDTGTSRSYFNADRLRGWPTVPAYSVAVGLSMSNSDIEANVTGPAGYMQTSFYVSDTGGLVNTNTLTYITYNFRRAPGFFDVVCFYATAGTAGSPTQTFNHNLGVTPELAISKTRGTANSWFVYSSTLGTTKRLRLQSDGAEQTPPYFTALTSSTFTIDNYNTGTPADNNVAYLFATCAGVSKVGSYTGTGALQTIDCGFTGGARFVLIKRTDSTGDWYVWDTARGIVAGNDPHLSLNSTAAEVTTNDSIDTDSTGFIVNQLAATNINVSSATYIYLAIA